MKARTTTAKEPRATCGMSAACGADERGKERGMSERSDRIMWTGAHAADERSKEKA